MSNFIPFETPSGTIWIQVEETVDGAAVVNNFQAAASDTFDAVVAAATSNAQLIRDRLVNLQPSGVEIAFGIKAGLNPGAPGVAEQRIFALAKDRESANYWVKVKWGENGDAV